jgi:amino acid transporter
MSTSLPNSPSAGSVPNEPRKRVLSLWDLIIYGIVLIQPIAPVGIFGIVLVNSRGHVVATILIAMVAMMLTAFSYGRMAARYPSAGSAYTYVGRTFGPYVGFLTGWAMFLDYLIIPAINTIYGALTMQRLVPTIPYPVWAALIVGLLTFLNLRGVRSMARANTLMLAVMTAVIGAFVFLAIRYLFQSQGMGGVFSFQALYNPQTFDARAVLSATSLAALTYIGFDGVTTLAEEVKNPRRNVPLATVLVCLFTGIFSIVEVYLGQRVWPEYETFPNIETAYMDVTQRVGGLLLFQAVGAIVVVACFGSGLSGQAGAARLLFGMGRDNMLPRRFFGRLDAKRCIPVFNILLIGSLTFVAALLLSYERAVALLNFGAFLSFMGVNLAAIREFVFRPAQQGRRNLLGNLLAPALGFLFCFGIWWSLPTLAHVSGGVWFVLGIAYLAIKTSGFRIKLAAIEFIQE